MVLSPHRMRCLTEAREELLAPADIDHPVPVATLAARCGLTPTHFIRQFRAVFGETPHQLRLRERHRRVRLALALTERSVTDIGLDAGAASLGTFSTTFRAHEGRSPSGYRRAVRQAVPDDEERHERLVPSCMGLLHLVAASTTISEKRRAAAWA